MTRRAVDRFLHWSVVKSIREDKLARLSPITDSQMYNSHRRTYSLVGCLAYQLPH